MKVRSQSLPSESGLASNFQDPVNRRPPAIAWRRQAQATADAAELSTVRERKKAPAKAAVTQE